MQFLTTKGVSLKTLGDLTNTANYERLGTILRSYFDEILIDEPKITADTLNESQRELINTGRNPKTWIRPQREDFENKTSYDRARIEYDRRLIAFRSLLNNHPQAEHWQQTASQLIADKWAELSGKNCCKFTDLQGNAASEQNGAIVANLPFILNVNLQQTGQLNTIPQTQVCKVTGTDISEQKKGSLFIGETTLRNDADLLEEVTKQHRSKKRKRNNHDAAYYAAHNIRNKHTNAANNLRKRLLKLKKDSGLFEVSEVVRLPDEKRELLKRWEGTEFEVNL